MTVPPTPTPPAAPSTLRAPLDDSPFQAILAATTSVESRFARPESRVELLDRVLELAAAERVFVVAPTADGGDKPWRVLAARTCEREDVLHPLEKLILPLLEPCRSLGQGYFTANLEVERAYEQLSRDRQPRTRSLLVVPLPGSSRFLYVDHRFQSLTLHPLVQAEFGQTVLTLALLEADDERKQLAQERDEELREARRLLRERRPTKPGAERRETTPVTRDPRGFRGDFSQVIGRAPDLLEVLEVIEKVAPTTAPVLINGESGTGKELVARAIHDNSDRSGAAFISENCAALTETLLESELFGYVRGAFTGAQEDRPGLFELASGGTLFLDEVGDTSPTMQKKLLRSLQEGVVRRVGGAALIPVDVRVIAATNKDLAAEVRAGRFREDLFYRLNVINVVLPPLRERRQDVPLLVEHFLQQLRQESGQVRRLDPSFEQALLRYHWPGNIRELQNEIRRAVALSDDCLTEAHLSPAVRSPDGVRSPGPSASLDLDSLLGSGSLRDATETLEKQIIEASLRRYRGNKARICEQLQIPKTTLYAKLKRYGLAQD
ncbi:MAG: sigma-54 interaction domain-containing protein [Planctomycetota bacterium]